MKTTTTIGAIALFLAGLGGLFAGCKAPEPEPAAPPAPAPPVAPVFTQAQFDQILNGMTYGQVADLLGAESSRQESTYDEGESEFVRPSLTAWHYWENADGSYIKVGFVEKQVAEKSAENLPGQITPSP